MSTLLFAACRQAGTANVAETAKRYPLKGKVVSVNLAKKKVTIEHESIPGFMDAMTMDFSIKEDWVWDELQPGVEVRAELVVDNSAPDPYWLEKIGIIAAPVAGLPQPPDPATELVGKQVPDFALTNQDGRRISLKDFRGKALAITFIYSQCPLPEYCIKMSTNFSDLANDLAVNDEYQEKVSLLSISFDPARDTPEKLREYGIGYLGKDSKADFSIWQLAVGSDKEVRAIADFFGLKYEVDPNDKTQFMHSLRTAVISPNGRVIKVFGGNEWTSDDLFRALKAAVAQP